MATPIGNLGDLSPRALAAFREADAVVCEDTRVTGGLLARHGIAVTMSPLHEHNEEAQVPALLDRLRQGQRIALASDAGTPLVSDPGYRLVRAAIAAGLPVTAIPGPNAAVMALTLSGLPPDSFYFVGFLPQRAGPRAAQPMAANTIVDVADKAGTFKTLLAAAQAAGLVDTLKSPGPFTVFAPTDAAFAKLPKGTVENLLKPENKEQLARVLKHHVVSGKVMSKDIAGKRLTADTAAGTKLAIDARRGVRVGGATVTAADVEASNGVIHVVDRVILPPRR